MKLTIFALMLTSLTASAVEIAPYSKSANKYMVDGKELSASSAITAAQQGKLVLKCKTQKIDTIYMVNGKAITGEEMSKCTPQMLAETANGLGFKAKK